MMVDSMMDLYEAGVITNKKKSLFKDKFVCTFAMGSRRLYDWLDDNLAVEFQRGKWVNDPAVVRQNSSMVSLNTCLMVDFTGQVASESIGTRQYSGTGGQTDTAVGAKEAYDGLGQVDHRLPLDGEEGDAERRSPHAAGGHGGHAPSLELRPHRHRVRHRAPARAHGARANAEPDRRRPPGLPGGADRAGEEAGIPVGEEHGTSSNRSGTRTAIGTFGGMFRNVSAVKLGIAASRPRSRTPASRRRTSTRSSPATSCPPAWGRTSRGRSASERVPRTRFPRTR